MIRPVRVYALQARSSVPMSNIRPTGGAAVVSELKINRTCKRTPADIVEFFVVVWRLPGILFNSQRAVSEMRSCTRSIACISRVVSGLMIGADGVTTRLTDGNGNRLISTLLTS